MWGTEIRKGFKSFGLEAFFVRISFVFLGYPIFKSLWRNSFDGSIPAAGVLKNTLRRCCDEVYNVLRVGDAENVPPEAQFPLKWVAVYVISAPLYF